MNNNQKKDSIYNSYQTNNQSLNKQEAEPYRTENVTIGKKISRVIMMISLVAIIVLVGGFALVYTGVIKINDIGPQAILLNASNIGVKSGNVFQYDYQVYPENSTAKNVRYESSDPSVAEINEVTGYITPKKEGTTKITIKSTTDDSINEVSYLSVTKDKVAISDIKLSSEKIVFDLNSKTTSQLLKVITEPYNATDQELLFETSDPSVATVDQSGRVYPIGVGTTTVAVRAKDGSASAMCEVVVDNTEEKVTTTFEEPDKSKIVFPTSIQLDTNNLKLKYGTSRKVGFILLPPDVTEDVVTWISSDPTVATVNNGLVTGNAVGETTVTARTVNDLVANLKVEVTDDEVAANYVEFRDETAEMEIGETRKLDIIYDSNATVQNFNWSSSDPDIIKVDNEGNVTALAKGSATITVSLDETTDSEGKVADKSSDTIVIIADGLDMPNYLTVSDTVINLGTGETRQLNVESDTGNENLVYQSMNSEIVTVNKDTGLLYGVSAGQTEVKISAANGVSATIVVNVMNVEASNIIIGTPSGTTIKKGNTLDLTAEIWPKNTTEKKIIWTSSNPNVATINEVGTITANAVGQTTITASVGSQSTSIVIKVSNEEVDNSSLKQSNVLSDIQIETLKKTPIIFEKIGETRIKATLDLENQGYINNVTLNKTTFKIVSNDSTVKNLKIKNISDNLPLSKYLDFSDASFGKITIKASVYLPGNKKTIEIEPSTYTIKNDRVIEINIPTDVTVPLSNYFRVDEVKNVSNWTINNDEIISISDGNITGLSAGTAYITGSSNGYTFSAKVNVTLEEQEENKDKTFSFVYGACYSQTDLCSVGTLKSTTLATNKSVCGSEKPYYVDKQQKNYKFVCQIDKKTKETYTGVSTYSIIEKELDFNYTNGTSVIKGESVKVKISNWNKLNLASATITNSLANQTTTVKKDTFTVSVPENTDATNFTVMVEAKSDAKNPKVYRGVLSFQVSDEFVLGSISCENEDKLTLVAGKSKTLSCVLIDKHDTSRKVSMTAEDNPTFTSSNTKIATVDKTTGELVAKKNGTANITVKAHGVSTKIKLTVEKAPPTYTYLELTLNKGKKTVTNVKLDETDLTLKYAVGETKNSKNKITSGLNVIFTNSNPDVLTIDENKVTLLAAGTTTITATYINSDGSTLTSSINITVEEKTPVISELTCADNLNLVVGTPVTINCQANDTANNRRFTVSEKPDAFSFKVDNTKIVQVSAGVITPVKAGKTTIKVTSGKISKNITVNVSSGQPVYTKLRITNLDNGTLLNLNNKESITIKYELDTDTGYVETDNTEAVVTISKSSPKDTKIVKISDKTITANKAGDATIKVSLKISKNLTLSDTRQITVYENKTCYAYKKPTVRDYEACRDGYGNIGSNEETCFKIIEEATNEASCVKDSRGVPISLRTWSNGKCLSQDSKDTYYPEYNITEYEYAYFAKELEDYKAKKKNKYKEFTFEGQLTCRGDCNATACSVK